MAAYFCMSRRGGGGGGSCKNVSINHDRGYARTSASFYTVTS